MAPMNYRRGFNRIYLMLSMFWALWWIVVGAVYTPWNSANKARALSQDFSNYEHRSCREQAAKASAHFIDQSGRPIDPGSARYSSVHKESLSCMR